MDYPIFPKHEALKPALDKLEANDKSIVLVAIQKDGFGHPDVSWAWFSAEERAELKRGLARAKKKREVKSLENK